jgi:hypothetical protein
VNAPLCYVIPTLPILFYVKANGVYIFHSALEGKHRTLVILYSYEANWRFAISEESLSYLKKVYNSLMRIFRAFTRHEIILR